MIQDHFSFREILLDLKFDSRGGGDESDRSCSSFSEGNNNDLHVFSMLHHQLSPDNACHLFAWQYNL